MEEYSKDGMEKREGWISIFQPKRWTYRPLLYSLENALFWI